MGYIGANWLAILAATAAGLLVGALSDRATRRLDARRGPAVSHLLVAVLAEAWLAAILAGALILAPAAGPGPWVMALASAVVIWIGFILPTVLVSGLHAGLPFGRGLAYGVHWLAVLLVQAAVLQAIGLAKPA